MILEGGVAYIIGSAGGALLLEKLMDTQKKNIFSSPLWGQGPGPLPRLCQEVQQWDGWDGPPGQLSGQLQGQLEEKECQGRE